MRVQSGKLILNRPMKGEMKILEDPTYFNVFEQMDNALLVSKAHGYIFGVDSTLPPAFSVCSVF
jgi:hypothetical protein